MVRTVFMLLKAYYPVLGIVQISPCYAWRRYSYTVCHGEVNVGAPIAPFSG